jgi:hypothetical protein
LKTPSDRVTNKSIFFFFPSLIFNELALSVALESSVDEDLRKVRFAMSLLFDDEVAKSKKKTFFFIYYYYYFFNRAGVSNVDMKDLEQSEQVEDLLSSIFEQLPKLNQISPNLNFETTEEVRQRAIDDFYDNVCSSKLEELILLQLSKKSNTVAKLSGDYIKQMLKSLNSSVGLVLRSERLLEILVWDYLIPVML